MWRGCFKKLEVGHKHRGKREKKEEEKMIVCTKLEVCSAHAIG